MLRLLFALAIAASFAAPAAATSGFGCYRVNLGPSDPLNIRSGPSARTAVIGAYSWSGQPIIALDANLPRGPNAEPSLFDVHQAEFAACQPSTLPLGARWCPVQLFDGSGSRSGWLKRRFVDHSECP